MFRKAQRKLFAVITGILLAVFIAVLGSINLIMQSVMQRQSKEVLKQVAAGVEYDDKTSTFTYERPGFPDLKPNNRYDPPPSKPDGEPGTDKPISSGAETSTSPVTTVNETTAPAVTTMPAATSAAETTKAVTTGRSETAASVTLTTVTTAAAVQPDPSMTQPPSGHGHGDRPWDPDGGRDDGKRPGNFPPYGDKDYKDDNEWDDHTYENNLSSKNVNRTIVLLDNAFQEELAPNGNQKKGSGEVPKSLGSIDFFIIMADTGGGYLATLNNDEIGPETAQKYINSVAKKNTSSGMVDNYQFYQMEKDNGTLMVFTDKSAEMDMLRQLTRTTVVIGALSFILLSAAAFFISRKIMQPLKTAFEKQKQFISDASHELKTPLTVISANADVLSGEIGNNKWLTYIKSQTDRMNVLVNDLLHLTRLENNTGDFIRMDFDLSKAVVNTALPFECQAFETNKKFEVDVDDGISVNGSERHIKQMAAIFIDNALKYSGDGGTVRVTLKKQGDKKILSVFNTGHGVKDSEKDKIFERFYRSDDSRSRATGGYGLGLAIAKSIIDKHKFKVTVDNEEGRSICFIVTM